MKKLYFLFLILSINTFFAQDLIWQKENNFNAVKNYQSGALNRVIKIDNDENSYTGGTFYNDIGFTNDNNYQLVSKINVSTAYIVKLDKNGNYIWAKAFYGDSITEISSINIDKNGDLIITGTNHGHQIDLNPDPLIEKNYNNPSSYNSTFIVKLDKNGNFIFGNLYLNKSGNSYSELDSDGNIITFGEIYSKVDFDEDENQEFIIDNNMSHTNFILKTNNNGKFIWVKHIKSQNGRFPYISSLKINSKDEIIFKGSYDEIFNYNNQYTYNNNNTTSQQHYISKIDKDGNFIWLKNLDLYDYPDYCFNNAKIAINDLNEIYFAEGTDYNYKKIVKIKDNSDFIWTNTIKSNSNNGITSIIIDSKEDVFLSFYTDSKLVDVTSNFGTEYLKTIDEGNGVLLKFSKNGKLIYNKSGFNFNYQTSNSFDKYDNFYNVGGYRIGDRNPDQEIDDVIDAGFFNGLGFIQKLKNCYSTTPDGDKEHSFCSVENKKLSDLYPKTSYTTWYDSKTNPIPLNKNTLLENKTYYASVQDESCPNNPTWLEVKVKVDTFYPKLIVSDFYICRPDYLKLSDLNIDKTKGELVFYDENGNVIASDSQVQENKKYFVAYKTTLCESEKAEFKVFSISPKPIASNLQTFCKSTNAKIKDILVNGQNLTWYNIYANILNVNTILEDGKTYYVTQRINNCESEQLAITVKIQDTDLPTATSPQTFCAIDVPKISNISITGQNIIWYDASGNILNSVTPLIDGTTYYASQTINGCESDKIAIQVKVNATPLPTGNVNQDFCTSRNAQIKDLAVTGTSLKFYDNLGNVLPNTTLLQNNTSYFVTQTLNNCESPKLEIKVTLTANSLPANDYQLTFCNDTTANSKTEDLRKYQENIITGSSAYSFEYFDQNNNPISDFANRNLIIGFNIFNVKVKSADGCWKMVQLKLQLNPKPVVNLPVNAEFCKGLSVDIDAGAGFKKYEWTKDSSPTVIWDKRIITISEAGKYTVEVTNSSDCKNTSSTLVNQSILANILKVEITNNDAKILLSANGDFVYSLDNSNWQNNPEFPNLNNGSYTVYVKTKLGCIIGEMNFTIFDIPNTFTPNSDGINDTWKITGMENYPNSEITILDRFGTAVLKKIINGTFEWNGQFNGRILPTGTYWYVLKVSDGRILQGYVLIKNRN